jgi:hypothetical protein
MPRLAILLLLLLAAATPVAAQISEPRLISAGIPQYPDAARQTHMTGEVGVDFELTQSGEPVNVKATDGTQFFREWAEKNVRTWRFEAPAGVTISGRLYTTHFRYTLAPEPPYDVHTPPAVTFDGYQSVEIHAIPHVTRFAEECPAGPQAARPIATGDFVELQRNGYSVRVSEDGSVLWKGGQNWATPGERRTRIPQSAAHALLQKFLDGGFFSLCGYYYGSSTSPAHSQIHAQLGGMGKRVIDRQDKAPKLYAMLENEIDLAADTHRFRHGDPATEPLSGIRDDVEGNKPGVTPLMYAAGQGNLDTLRQLLHSGASLEATDPSGWTALLYAAGNGRTEAVKALLAAGAQPNHASLRGDTPLMAAALRGEWSRELVEAGAQVNAQNADGTTALMILAARLPGNGVAEALAGGSNPHLKDRKGRDALAYLRLASCYHSPVVEYFGDFRAVTVIPGKNCRMRESPETKGTLQALRAAMQRRSR